MNTRCTGYPMTVEEAIRRIRLKLEVRKRDVWTEGMVCWVEIGEVERLIEEIERPAVETPDAKDAARYRWLTEDPPDRMSLEWLDNKAEVDEHIDEAMAQ